MILSDANIRTELMAGNVVIDPWQDAMLQPSSIDLTLGDTLKVWPDWITRDPRIDQSDLWRVVDLARLPDDEHTGPCWVLKPGLRYLATTAQSISLNSPSLGAQLDGRSTWARDGLTVHKTAGWLDPGYGKDKPSRPTLELSVEGSPLVIYPGADCAQLFLVRIEGRVRHLYGYPGLGSRYQGDTEPTPAKAVQR